MKTVPYINKGMVKDLSVSKVSNEFAYENYNIRIESRGDNSLLSCTNERGNVPVELFSQKISNKIVVTQSYYNTSSNRIYTTDIQLEHPTDVDLKLNFGGYKIVVEAGQQKYTFSGQQLSADYTFSAENSGYLFYRGGDYNDPVPESQETAKIEGTFLGYCVLSSFLVLFTCGDKDRIYRIQETDGKFYLRTLFEGDLNFDKEHPIETIPYYEAEEIQKIYWTDGLNQPRSINIVSDKIVSKATAFDFITTFESGLKLSVTKEHNGFGVFPAGTVQYVVTYYNKYGQETNAAFVSPMYYISDADRGNSPEETVTCSFRIAAENLDNSFDYIRVYSVLYTSEGTVSAAYVVGDISISSGDNILVDNGTRNESIDPTKILYLGGRQLSAYTFSHKDNTLFLGNLKSLSEKNTEKMRNLIRRNFVNADGESKVIKFEYSEDAESIPENFTGNSLYEYTHQLEYSSKQIKTFKGGEKYRFGLQFISDTGERSRVFWIGDKINHLYPKYDAASNTIGKAVAALDFSGSIATTDSWYQEVLQLAGEAGYTKAQIVIAEANESDRLVIAQGILNPTVFNLQQRVNNQPFAEASWYMRPRGTNMAATHFQDVNNIVTTEERWSQDSGERHYAPKGLSSAEIQSYDHAAPPYFDPASITTDYSTLDFSTKPVDSVPVGQIVRLYVYRWKHYTKLGFTDGDRWSYAYTVVNKYIDADSNVIWKARTGGLISGPVIPESSAVLSGLSAEEMYNRDKSAGILTESLYQDYKKGDVAYQDFIATVAGNNYVPTSVVTGDLSYDNVRAAGGLFSTQGYGYRSYVYEDLNYDWANPTADESPITSWYLSEEGDHFYVDESVVTLNSPELNLDSQNRSIDGATLRIVGAAKLSSNITDYTADIGFGRDSSSQLLKKAYNGFGRRSVAGLLSDALYMDSNMADRNLWLYKTATHEKGSKKTDDDTATGLVGYYIYPWHKEGSIIGWGESFLEETDSQELFAKLNSKIEANLRVAYPTSFVNSAWAVDIKNGDAQVFNGDSAQMLVLNKESIGQKLYFGNYDSLIVPKSKDGYPIFFSALGEDEASISSPQANLYSKKGVRIAYKSSPHAVISLGTKNNAEIILPRLDFEEEETFSLPEGISFPWLKSSDEYSVQQGILETPEGITDTDAYWLIGELCRKETGFEYGGTSDDALSKNTFVPAGEILSLEEIPQLRAVEGDTYYQRWDCIKTYPYAKDYTNSIVDIASVMVESHINLAGRYDRRRGMLENVTTSPENTGMVNKAYTQNQSMFSNISDTAVRSATDFPNQITWTGTKVPAALIDEWTHITLANTLDMDGDKGEIEAIRRFNSNLFCFQDKGISEILFNSRTQISTLEGVPIEIANSGKVEGKRYFTEHHGCLNKWSIVETASGIYFIDDLNKCISVLGEGIRNLSLEKGFDDWTKAHVTGKKWTPEAFGNAVSMYDRQFGDVYIIGKDFSLCFNEGLGQFTSFFSYESTPMMTLLDGKLLAYKDGHIWKQNAGDYNVFFGEHKPYYLEYRITPEPYGDKTFTNIEYRADMWAGETYDAKGTFDVLDVSTEYQTGSDKLDWRKAMPANMQKKLRIWRAFIPRDANDPRRLNRIRNPWMKMRLTKDTEGDTERMEFHNLLVSYIE